jgi:hypothetical protein
VARCVGMSNGPGHPETLTISLSAPEDDLTSEGGKREQATAARSLRGASRRGSSGNILARCRKTQKRTFDPSIWRRREKSLPSAELLDRSIERFSGPIWGRVTSRGIRGRARWMVSSAPILSRRRVFHLFSSASVHQQRDRWSRSLFRVHQLENQPVGRGVQRPDASG